MAEDLDKYSTAAPYGTLPTWINTADAHRIAAYQVYDAMTKVVPESFAAMLRGSDEPILIPTAKGILNTLTRFVGRGFDIAVDPAMGSDTERAEAALQMKDFVKRERIKSKFKIAVRETLKFGDAFWYIQGDSLRPEGKRVSISVLDPSTVQILPDPDDEHLVVGVQVVEQVVVGDDTLIRRQRWLKALHAEHPAYNEETPVYDAPIVYDKVDFELDGWEGEDRKQVTAHVQELALPVNTLPIYHWKNASDSDDMYGTSELQGLERVFSGINQAITDEDLALSMAGLGMYKSSSGGPVDENGDAVDWVIGPGRVVEDESFDRVNGVNSFEPSLDHIKYLETKADAATGVTDVARGGVDASIAESGIALTIKLGPTLDAAEEKDQEMRDVFDNLLFDLRVWFQALEGWNFENVRFLCTFGDKMPKNRESEIKEILSLVEAKVIPVEYAQTLLKERYGYDLPANAMEMIANETSAAAAASDPFGDRLADPEAEAGLEAPVE